MHLGFAEESVAEENCALRPTQIHRWPCWGSRPCQCISRE